VQLNDKFFQIHPQIDINIKKGTFLYENKNIFTNCTFGKITASQKANLSINKKIVIHKFKFCIGIEHNVLFRLFFNQRFFDCIEFTDNFKGV